MSLIQAKQIEKKLQAFVGISGFASGGGTSDTVTTALGTTLGSAGDNGVSVPLQVGSRLQEGVNVATGANLCNVYDGTTGLRAVDGNGNDVYAKITNSGNVWTLSYYSAPGGTETAYAMANGRTINFEFPYVFSLEHLPFIAMTAVTDRHVAPDLSSFGYREQGDALTVTAANTLSALSQAYKAGGKFQLIVNGVVYTNLGAAPPVTASGNAVTWNATNAGFALAVTDDVKAYYNY